MNLVSYFKRAIDHDAWANREICRSFASIGTPPDKAVSLFAHIIGAEWTWLARLEHDVKKPVVWPSITLTECRKELGELHDAWAVFFETVDEAALSKEVAYTNSKGEPYTNTVADVLTHLVTHSSYHRGQIATLLRQNGHEPPYTDFIHAVRQGHLDRG